MTITVSPKGMRVSKGKTQQELANVLGLSLSQYKRKENEEVRFYADELYELSLYYNVPVSIFFENEVSLKDTRRK